ncbi:MAG: GtrA family protein [Bacilli bacterium]|nr:GtrA family protein [Bacilli bacterium]
MEKKLIIKGHDKNPFVKFWNWGWGIYYKNPEIWNYLIVGLLTTVVSLVTYFIATRTILNPEKELELQIANIISWIFAVAFAYVTNRIFVFKSKNKNIFGELSKFIGSRIASLIMDMLIMLVIVSIMGLSDIVGKVFSQIVVTIANYILSKLLVFTKKESR